MAIFLSELDHRWDFDELSGNILDKIGSKDSNVIGGASVYNGNSVTFDGVNDSFTWPSASNPILHSGDWTFYIVMKFIEDPDAAVILAIDGDDAPTTFQQVVHWDDVNKVNNFRATIGGNTLNFDASRLLKSTETVVIMGSYDRTGNSYKHVHKSDDPSTPYDLSGTDAITTDPNVQNFYLGRNNAGTTLWNIEVFEMGSIDGTAKSIVDMQDTAAEILNPTLAIKGGGERPSFRLDVLRQTRYNRGLTRFLR